LKSLTSPAFAKINLGLRVLRKRQDGFHGLETVFLRIGWKDELTFSQVESTKERAYSVSNSDLGMIPYQFAGPIVSLSCSDERLPVDDGNLCMRAAIGLLAEHSRMAPPEPQPDRVPRHLFGIQMQLDKRIPFGAGLGGGSSDAATVLIACSRLWGMNYDLHSIAGRIGSDVPFFLGSGVALGTGRGEVLSEVNFPRALLGTRLLIVVPDQRVSTAEAYRDVVPNSRHRVDLNALVAEGTLSDWGEHLTNDFEPSVFGRYPIVLNIKQELLHSGAAFALMSGSGSAVFGVFSSQDESLQTLDALRVKWPSFSYWEGAADSAI
jgi:4-diphosphocytidyl-2-C-methyl-D-erythritol kinase